MFITLELYETIWIIWNITGNSYWNEGFVCSWNFYAFSMWLYLISSCPNNYENLMAI